MDDFMAIGVAAKYSPGEIAVCLAGFLVSASLGRTPGRPVPGRTWMRAQAHCLPSGCAVGHLAIFMSQANYSSS